MFKLSNINSIRFYKPCYKKAYKVWACKPPVGTLVINSLEQAGVLMELAKKMPVFQKRAFLTAQEGEQVKLRDPSLYQYIVKNGYLITENAPFVLSGTQGEMWTISADKLAKIYTFASGEAITNATFTDRCKVISNKGVVTEPRGSLPTNINNIVMPWQKLATKQGDSNEVLTFACHVPVNEVLQIQTSWGAVLTVNDKHSKHGKGDFVLCSATADGTPNLNDKWVVNGLVFGATYNNRGWSDNLMVTGKDVSSNLPRPRELF